MSNQGVCERAPATLGLLNMYQGPKGGQLWKILTIIFSARALLSKNIVMKI